MYSVKQKCYTTVAQRNNIIGYFQLMNDIDIDRFK